jgi:hypothetical protein
MRHEINPNQLAAGAACHYRYGSCPARVVILSFIILPPLLTPPVPDVSHRYDV